MSRLYSLLVLLLTACPAGLRGLTPATLQISGTVQTVQPCIDEAEVLRIADLAVVLFARASGVPYRQVRELLGQPLLCLIQHPEPCRLGPICAVGSKGQDCLPRAGCAGDGWAWVSREWPSGVVRDWRGDLVHEIGHLVGARLGWAQAPNHRVPWAEVEARVQEQYRACR